MKDHEASLCFIEADVAQSLLLSPREVLAAENPFREWIGETLDHRSSELVSTKRIRQGECDFRIMRILMTG